MNATLPTPYFYYFFDDKIFVTVDKNDYKTHLATLVLSPQELYI